ncbi:MAG: TolC family protein [Candidatus Edwardsbacteria bacterium]
MTLNFYFLFVLGLVSANSFATAPLSLNDCISLAKENNSTLLQAKMEIEQSRVGVREAYSPYYPDLGLSSGYNYGGDFSGKEIRGIVQ